VNEGVMHQVVRAHLLNQRQGTGSAKSRSEVRGSGAKPFRQKGTGRARQGTVRAAQMEGGGRAFPPIPHSWRQKVPRKVRALARRSALNDRAEHDRVVMVDLPSMAAPKTQDLLAFLALTEIEGKVLLLTDGQNANVYKSARNLPHVQVMPFGGESVYDVLWANIIVIERGAIEDGKKKAAPKAKAPATAENEEDDDA
jgi:large subunit ribosomal protein L4